VIFLAVDCSTTAAKALAIGPDGVVLASGIRGLALSQPKPGWYEQDPQEWWSATRDALAEVVAQIDPAKVTSICLTHQRESFVCLRADGSVLRPAILWADGRAGAQIAELGGMTVDGRTVHELSGKPPDVTPALYKLAWLRAHEPSVLAAARFVGDVHAYLSHRLTGRWVTSAGSADSLGLFDLRRLTWSPALLDLAGLRVDQLPEVVAAGQEVGVLSASAAEIGLPAVPVIAGTGDGQAAGLAAGLEAGSAYLNLGTSMVLGVQSSSYVTDPAFRTLAGVIPGTFVLETILNSAAYLAGWFRQQFGEPALGGAPDPLLDSAAAAVPPGADGLLTLPYWNAAQTPYWDAAARGATVGWHGGHTRAHLYRSILEGIGFELRLHLDGLEAATGQRISVLRAMGGGSRSRLWTQIIADITQRPVHISPVEEMSAMGAAVIARFAADAGALAGYSAAAEALAGYSAATAEMVGAGRTVVPRSDPARTYDALFGVYRQLYPALRGVFADLARPTPPSP
jgi:xylulokinase